MSERAKFRYSANEGLLELEGSEDFVSKHFECLGDIIREISRQTVTERKKEPLPDSAHQSLDSKDTRDLSDGKRSIHNYPGTYSEINGKLKVVAEVPGKTKQEKMMNAALLYCYGSELMGCEQVDSRDIRSLCEEHGFLDGSNFSRIFDDKTIFVIDGVKRGPKSVRLTYQGRKEAEELL